MIAIGPDCTSIKVGDTILFGRYGKFDIPLRGEEFKDHFIINEPDIIAKIKGE